jgi:hypothetical protein
VRLEYLFDDPLRSVAIVAYNILAFEKLNVRLDRVGCMIDSTNTPTKIYFVAFGAAGKHVKLKILVWLSNSGGSTEI